MSFESASTHLSIINQFNCEHMYPEQNNITMQSVYKETFHVNREHNTNEILVNLQKRHKKDNQCKQN